MIEKVRYARVMANLSREINGNRTLLAAPPSSRMAEYEAWLAAAKKDELVDGAAALAAALFRAAGNTKWQQHVRLHVQTCSRAAKSVARSMAPQAAAGGVAHTARSPTVGTSVWLPWSRWKEATRVAISAIEARMRLWDAVREEVRGY